MQGKKTVCKSQMCYTLLPANCVRIFVMFAMLNLVLIFVVSNFIRYIIVVFNVCNVCQCGEKEKIEKNYVLANMTKSSLLTEELIWQVIINNKQFVLV